MKRIVFLLAMTLMASSTIAAGPHDAVGRLPDKGAQPDPTLTIKENAYAPGIGLDQYNRPVVLAPAGKAQGGGSYTNSYIVKRDAFGPGIHMDQYGRPVQIVPR
ncbi:hypothetical protein LPW11_13585 [Geomonas sp. RF6]|uniref:hypothetical protein n=1 Tax=Geomonas sp. RF6 TaxID=2897342 RepID=UPI001E54743B|nr:hypothetical protein [Geomonas sp. RF6]UFS68927.1 hypothetical protein LPW11_13585 [Geomonas sp. RF6]